MQIQDVLIHLLLKQPFYGYMAASVTPAESREVANIDIRMTPTPKLLYNKAWYESLKGEQPVGVLIHELLHMVLLHFYRGAGREAHLWPIACDMAVNEHIDKDVLPEEYITVEKIAKELGVKIPRLKSAEYYYDIISREEQQLRFIVIKNEVKVVLGNGQELRANIPADENTSEVCSKASQSMIRDLVEQAGNEGDIPDGIGRYIEEIYRMKDVDWRNVLKRFLTGKGKMLARSTCKRESKRFEDLPGKKRLLGTTALLALDESGSITDESVAKFYNELLSIRKITGADIYVTRFDTDCTQPVPVNKYVRRKVRVKSGGTDFRPAFQMADKMRIPLLIIFTDGDGTAPVSANQKVLWVITKGGKKPAPYGHCLMFNE